MYCVRFLKDGVFLATGGVGITYIFDLHTGSLVPILHEETVSQEGEFCTH